MRGEVRAARLTDFVGTPAHSDLSCKLAWVALSCDADNGGGSRPRDHYDCAEVMPIAAIPRCRSTFRCVPGLRLLAAAASRDSTRLWTYATVTRNLVRRR